jgi:hypothetical protein
MRRHAHAQERDSVLPRETAAKFSSALLRSPKRTRVTIPIAELGTPCGGCADMTWMEAVDG